MAYYSADISNQKLQFRVKEFVLALSGSGRCNAFIFLCKSISITVGTLCAKGVTKQQINYVLTFTTLP